MKGEKIIATLVDGGKKEFDALFSFKNEQNGKNYIVYTDNTKDAEGKLRIYASCYDPVSNKFLSNPETSEEWKIIYELLEKVLNNN